MPAATQTPRVGTRAARRRITNAGSTWFDAQLQQELVYPRLHAFLRTAILEGGLRLIWTHRRWLKNYLLGPGGLPPAPSGGHGQCRSGRVVLSWTNPPITLHLDGETPDQHGGPYVTMRQNQ